VYSLIDFFVNKGFFGRILLQFLILLLFIGCFGSKALV